MHTAAWTLTTFIRPMHLKKLKLKIEIMTSQYVCLDLTDAVQRNLTAKADEMEIERPWTGGSSLQLAADRGVDTR